MWYNSGAMKNLPDNHQERKMGNAHRINNPDHYMHGLYCACGASPCISAPKRVLEASPSKVDAFWAALPHDVRQQWRAKFQFDGPWQTVADMAYEHARKGGVSD